MVIAFQIVLIVIMLFAVLSVVAERDNKEIRDSMVVVLIAVLTSLIVSMWML